MRRIAVVTGTRADYGIYSSIFRAIDANSLLELEIIAAGMHLLSEFGNTLNQIKNDGFAVAARVKAPYNDDTMTAMAKNVGAMTTRFADILVNMNPTILTVLGDRGEMLAAATAAAYLGIPIAHIHGGEVSGTVDEVVRHAITKFSNLHFAATKKSASRIIKLGEIPANVYVVGAPSLDTIIGQELPTKVALEKNLGIKVENRFILVIQHAVTTQVSEAAAQMEVTLRAVKDIGLPVILIYPNSDAGGRAIIEVIKSYRAESNFHIYKNLPHKVYLALLRDAAVLVGNTSSGMIESSSFKTPAVNIGIRQNGRERSSNVIDVGHNVLEIKQAIKTALNDKKFIAKVAGCRNPYGDGTAGKKIAKILSTVTIDDKLLQKKITY